LKPPTAQTPTSRPCERIIWPRVQWPAANSSLAWRKISSAVFTAPPLAPLTAEPLDRSNPRLHVLPTHGVRRMNHDPVRQMVKKAQGRVTLQERHHGVAGA